MAEIILSQVGAAAGARLLPNGIGILGRSVSGAAIGEAIGRFSGRAIDASLAPASEGPRIKSLHVMESREGAGLPLVYGRMRVGGQLIWASRFKEYRTEQSAGKGGPSYSEYTYSVSFAVALCQGPITRVDRIWANGELLALNGLNWRLYTGTETQQPDPLIEAIEGAGQVPSNRGTAYIVFEDFPLDAYGNHLPQLSFEIVRAGQTDSDSLSESVDGVNIIPATGEFVYATSIVRERRFPGIERPLNMNNSTGAADFSVSLDQLKSDLPNARHAALTVAWFGDDLRAGSCRIRPGIEDLDRETVPYAWTVSNLGRESAHLVSRTDDRPNFGGTPADQAVIDGIQAMKAAGLSVTLSPFLLMDIPTENGLPDPYGGAEQAAFPWRGRLTVPSDHSVSAREDIEAFIGEDWAFGFRHFILHQARLAEQAGGVDAFLIGSEMIGLTRVRDQAGGFPFVEALKDVASDVRAIVGPSVQISYAADWTEYGAYVPPDGSGDVLFPLDPLWASQDVDFIGIDWYPPVSDWRDGEDHLDALAGFEGNDDAAYLRQNLAGGEAFDWYYSDAADRAAQVRTPIKDTAHGEDWIFRQKDIANWWSLAHHERSAGARSVSATPWVPQSKPIRLIELGFPAVDKGTNAPNVFFDPKSSESALPHSSNGGRDDLLQRRALAVANDYWRDQPMIDQVLNWAWDGRPWPDFPSREDVWSDGPNWQFGHWLNGRTGLINIAEVVDDLATHADTSIDASGINGALDGFALDTVTSLANALAPLASAFEFSLTESDSGFSAAHDGTFSVSNPALESAVEDSYSASKVLLDKQPSGVSLHYISGDLAYEPAVVEARLADASQDLNLEMSYPIVMGQGRAAILADRALSSISQTEALTVSLSPGVGSQIEILDRITFDDTDWIVRGIEEHGLRRQLNLRAAAGSMASSLAIDAPSASPVAVVPAEPVLSIVDGPALEHLGGNSIFAAVSGDPWVATQLLKMGATVEALSDIATVSVPSAIGQLESDLTSGPLGRWDESGVIEVYLPSGAITSVTSEAVLAGQNRLLIETSEGWELAAWRDAELVGDDRWRLSGLLRGLSGSRIGGAEAGAQVVIADDRLIPLLLGRDDVGQSLTAQVGSGEPIVFSVEDNASAPWRVGHLRAQENNGVVSATWTARGPQFSSNWELSDPTEETRSLAEAYLGQTLVWQSELLETETVLPEIEADLLKIAAVSADGRVGEWGSIPLPAA